MKDGLYRVETKYLTAGFIIRRGGVAKCAPVLHKRIGYWKTIAKWIAP